MNSRYDADTTVTDNLQPGRATLADVKDSPQREAQIRAQLARVLASPGFVNSARMCQFLRFAVEASLSGKESLKETVIGVEVFSRAPGYDSSIEPIVRVEARRLRDKLQQYYALQGANDEVIITLPKGGYTPEFEIRPASQAEAGSSPVAATAPISRPGRWLFPVLGIAAILAGAATVPLWVRRNPSPPARSRINSIAVLPLANLSGDPAQDYLADGMTDELITKLANISALRVISRTSAMRYKGVSKPLPEIAKELTVDALVEGSVTRSGRHVRITAQLIDGKTDRYLWSNDYSGSMGNILAVENEVARAIAKQVTRTLSANEQSRFRAEANIPPEAYDAYLKGRYFWNKRTEDGLRTSIGYFNQALAKAPTYALAWAGLADSYLLLGENWVRPPGESFAKARKAADKALQLDDDLGEAHATRAALDADLGHWDQAEPEFRRALALSPGYATAYQWYAEELAAHGRTREALEQIRRAQELDPLSLIVNVQVGYILFLARRYDDAIAQFRAALQMNPQFFFAHADLGQAYEQKRMYPEAISELQKAADLTNHGPGEMMWLARAWALGGKREEALRARAALEKDFAQGRIPASCMALLDLALGDRERAVWRLEAACSAHVPQPLSGPEFDPLRADPRIDALLTRCAPTRTPPKHFERDSLLRVRR
ncbi:MAG: tetratricopeptide repeat protein [Bryobacteraceae bacterium]